METRNSSSASFYEKYSDHFNSLEISERESKAAEKAKRRQAFLSLHGSKVSNAEKCRPKTRAERRGLQEKQRAAKGVLKEAVPQSQCSAVSVASKENMSTLFSIQKADVLKTKEGGNTVAKCNSTQEIPLIHSAIYQCGLWLESFLLSGCSTRCAGTALAIKSCIESLEGKSDSIFETSKFVEILLFQISFLEKCRTFSPGLENFIIYLRRSLFSLGQLRISKKEALTRATNFISEFLIKNVHSAQKTIILGMSCIRHDCSVLTYGHSNVIRELFRATELSSIHFNVTVMDAAPLFEGRKLFVALKNCPNISVTYGFINNIQSLMNGIDVILMGASAISSNGDVFSRSGSAVVSLNASRLRLPILILCEAYKFTHSMNKVITAVEDNFEIKDSVIRTLYDKIPPLMLTVVRSEDGPINPLNIGSLLLVKSQGESQDER